MLLARGADVNAHGNYHIPALLWAAGRGYSDIIRDLIAHGAKVNVGDKVIVGKRIANRWPSSLLSRYDLSLLVFSMAPRHLYGLRAKET